MSFRDRSGRIEAEARRVREAELEQAAERHTTEHPDPPADDPRTRGILARVREMIARRRDRGAA